MRGLLLPVAVLLVLLVPAVAHAANANLWVDSNGGTCTRQSPAGAYSDAGACSSLATACTAASADDSVLVKNGTYGSQTLSTSCSGTSGHRITFDAENGSTGCTGLKIVRNSVTSYTHNTCGVDYADITVAGHDLNVKNFSTPGWIDFPQSTSNVTARDTVTNAHSKGFSVNGTDITMEDGEVGGFYVCGASNWDGSGWIDQDLAHIGFDITNHTVSNILVDGYVFHDLYSRDGASFNCATGDPHPDCLQIASGSHVTIQNSEFYRCATSDIQSNSDFGPPYDNLSYIGNIFGQVYDAGNCCEMGTSDPLGSQSDDCSGTNVFAYNTLRSSGAISQVCSITGTFIFEGNLVPDGTSSVDWTSAGSTAPTIDYNVWGSGSLGTHSKTCTPSFAGTNDTFGGSLLSATDTCAAGAGKPSSTLDPSPDINGTTRLSTPDAGADEITSFVNDTFSPPPPVTFVNDTFS